MSDPHDQESPLFEEVVSPSPEKEAEVGWSEEPVDPSPGSQHEDFQQLYHDGRIDGVAVVSADARACPTCEEVSDRLYIPSQLPQLPVEGCTGSNGCRCKYEPSFTVYE